MDACEISYSNTPLPPQLGRTAPSLFQLIQDLENSSCYTPELKKSSYNCGYISWTSKCHLKFSVVAAFKRLREGVVASSCWISNHIIPSIPSYSCTTIWSSIHCRSFLHRVFFSAAAEEFDREFQSRARANMGYSARCVSQFQGRFTNVVQFHMNENIPSALDVHWVMAVHHRGPIATVPQMLLADLGQGIMHPL